MNDEIYRQEILDHFKNPRHFGELKDADRTGRAVNTVCGDELEFFLKIDKSSNGNGDIVTDVGFSGTGCAISMASASMLAERLKGKSIDEVRTWGREEILENLGIKLSPTRLKCALLPLEALHRAVVDSRERAH